VDSELGSPDSSNTEEEGTEDEEQNESKRTKVRLKAYDLEVEAESHEASFDEMASTLSEEFEKIRRDAMVAEYEEIEERNLHSIILGGE
jgi:hypothetical protein